MPIAQARRPFLPDTIPAGWKHVRSLFRKVISESDPPDA
jgi:hypothetical protein